MTDKQYVEQGRDHHRLFLIGALCALAWLSVILIDLQQDAERKSMSLQSPIPPLSDWLEASLQWPGHDLVRLRQKVEDISDLGGSLRGAHLDRDLEWSVKVGEADVEREMDPVLARGLQESLTEISVIETRTLSTEAVAHQLGLTEAALQLTISARGRQTLKLRIGAEHLRHSTWVRELSKDGVPSPIALRVNQRLQRSLSHMPATWPDRRLGVLGGGELIEVSCRRGAYRTEISKSHHSWTIIRSKRIGSWRIKTTQQLSTPPLDPSIVQGFVYTLKTLKVMTYLRRGDASGELSPTWRPTHSCSWVTDHGERGWVEFGQARLGSLGVGLTHLHELRSIASSQSGTGILPPHVAHFVTPALSQLLSRKLSPVGTDQIVRVEYTPSPAPLISAIDHDDSNRHRLWRLTKKSTGWWSERLISGKWLKAPISESSMSKWLALLGQESASVSYRVKPLMQNEGVTESPRTDQSTGAMITLTLSATRENSKGSDVTLKELISPRVNSPLHRWLRAEDQVEFTLSAAHAMSLARGPAW